MSLASGTVLAGRYRLLERLGEGGMGSVYKVEDARRPGNYWALKVLLDDRTMPADERAWALKRFEDEIALLATLHHPRIPAYIASFVDHGCRCFVMELVPGETLEERLERTKAPLPERDVLNWMSDVCDVLAYLHGQRPPIIVRDLKPGNIMVTPSGEVRLIDFGIARTYKLGKMSNTENLGTAIYASPEHHGQAQTDARSDIYSLGATMYHLLTNTEPTPLDTPLPGSLRRKVPTISEATERVVLRAMQLSPSQRFQTAFEMRDALRQCLTASSTPKTAPQPARTTNAAPSPRWASPTSAAAASSANAPARGATASPVRQLICPMCGFHNRPGARFCSRDGTPLAGTPARVAPPMAAPVTRVVPTVTTADLQARRATEAFNAGRYTQAVRQAETAVAQGRATYDLHLLLGRCYRQLRRPREAAESFARAAQLQPQAEALCLEGAAWREAGDLVRAQIALTRARQSDPRDPEISHQLGLICLEQGMLAQAEGEFLEGLRIAPSSAPLLLALGRVYAARKLWQEAIVRLRDATKADPKSAVAFRELGRAQIEAGARGDARTSLKHALALDANDAEASRLLHEI
jgi:Tfp pilus assembly protein PilF